MSAMPTTAAPPRRPRRARDQPQCQRDRHRTRCPRSTHPRQVVLARYYDPTIGRFTATDPLANLEEPGSLDAYGYGHGSPVTLSDPTGMFVPVGDSHRSGSYDARRSLRIDTATNHATRVRLPGRTYRPARPLREPTPAAPPPIGPPAPDTEEPVMFSEQEVDRLYYHQMGDQDWTTVEQFNFSDVDWGWYWFPWVEEYGGEWDEYQEAKWVDGNMYFEARRLVHIRDTTTEILTGPPEGRLRDFVPTSVDSVEAEQKGPVVLRGFPIEDFDEPLPDLFP